MSRYQQVDIQFSKGDDVYKVVMTGLSMDVFKQAAENPAINMLEGDALVAALLKHEGVIGITRYKNGQLHDGPNGEPAICQHDPAIGRTFVRLYKNGKLTDGPYGQPAVQDYLGGKLVAAQTYRYGSGYFRQMTRLELQELPAYIAENRKKSYWTKVRPH